MSHLWQRRLTIDMIVRILADAVMLNIALLLALTSRYLWLIEIERYSSGETTLHSYVRGYLDSVWLLILISLVVFYWSGFYTYGRRYRGRYKALVIGQAVSLSYLVFGFCAFFFPTAISLPRGALLPAWLFTLVFLIGARLWSMLWKAMSQAEHHLLTVAPQDSGVGRILVIGGAGYIGSALLPKLLSQGYHVRLLDLLLFGTDSIADVIEHPNLEILQADFRHVDKVVAAMAGIDTVIHLGAIVGDPACALDEELTIEVNLMATRMIAEVAKGSGVRRFIFASTCSVYGASDEVLDERSALHPVSLYARSKIASEQVLTNMADEGFAPVILRFGTIYGLSGRTRFDLVVNLLTAKALLENQITVFGGDQWRPFVHVDDAALAIFKALEAPQSLVFNEIFNVGSDEQNYTIQQVGELIHSIVPAARLMSMGSDTDRRNYKVNFGKIRHSLGFAPQRTLLYGIQQVVAVIESGAVKDYGDARYSNVKFLSEGTTAQLIHRENGWAYKLLNETAQESSLQEIALGEPLQVKMVGAEQAA